MERPEVQEKIRKDFARNQKNTYLDIRRALDADDHDTALRLAHTLKGMAGLIREETLVKVAKDVELLLTDGKEPDTQMLIALEVELKRVLKEIGLLENEGYKSLDREKAAKLFNKLAPMLESGNGKCLALLEELREVPESVVLIRLIEDFDFNAASRILEVLRGILEV